MATHSTILAWRIPWTGKPGRLYSPWGGEALDTTEQLPRHKAEIGNHSEVIRGNYFICKEFITLGNQSR